jgi:hypothetical protein
MMPTKLKDWKEVAYHMSDSDSSYHELRELFEAGASSNFTTGNILKVNEDDDYEDMKMASIEELGSIFRVSSRQEYQEMIAPFDQTEDYSTASMLKKDKTRLTMEVLATYEVKDIIKELIAKASIIDYERLVRLLVSACKLGKHPIPKESDLISALINELCLVSLKEGTLILKSLYKYD